MRVTRSRIVPIILSALLALPALLATQEPVTITGTVKSDAGQPLGQVQVSIPSLGLGALTKDDGRYTVLVPGVRVTGQSVALVARRLGYKSQSAQIALTPGAQTHDFTLAANPLQLGEVVVTGAGTVTQTEKLGNVRNQVDSSLIQRSDEMNFVEALAGKAPNVQVVSTAGDPGSSSFIQIRGTNTINGSSQPLIVIDGTPVDNSTTITGGSGNNVASTVAPNRGADVNPADIASIDILKGASAAAIYGARAGQGVVLITTKSGQAGPTRTTFRSEFFVNNATNGPALQTTYGQGSGGNPPGGTTGEPPVCLLRGCKITSGSWGPALPASVPRYDHFNELFVTGFISDNNLTVSGGDEKTLFYISGEYLYNRGFLSGPNNNFKRGTVRLKASQKLLSNLTLTGNMAYADTRGAFIQRGSNIDGLLLGSLRTPPEFSNWPYLDPLTGTQRTYRYPLPRVGATTVDPVTGTTRGYDNPFFVLNVDNAAGRVGRVYGNVNVSYLPVSWLKVEEVLGLDYSNDERLEALAQSSSGAPFGTVTEADYKNLQIDHNLTATASYTVSPTFGGTVTLGQGLNSRTHRQVEQIGNNLIAPSPFNLQNVVFLNPTNDSASFIHTQSFFGQATADLYNQLYLTAAVRNDGSSTFGASTRRHWFPKGSAAWEFTKVLNAGEGVGVLTYGKARLAYGQTGTEPGVYQTLNALSTAAFGDDGWGPSVTATQAGRGGIYSGFTKGQPALGPERTKEIEGGVDLAFLKSQRVDAHYTYYHETSSDVIFQAPLPPSTGFGQQAQNAATITNIGHEVSVNLRPVQTPEMSWSVGLQWGKNTNRVTSLLGTTFVSLNFAGFTDPQGAAIVGYPLGEIRGSDFERCGNKVTDATYGFIDTLPGLCKGAPKGAIFLAAGGYPVLDANFEPIADPTPKWTGSVQSSFQWRKWTVSGLLDIKHGGQIWNGTRGALTFFGKAANTLVRDVTRTFGKDYYTQFTFAGPGVGTAVLIDQANWYQGGLGSGFTGPSSQFIEDGGFVKLREIAVAYTFDQPWVHNTFGFDAIDVRVSGRNLKTWTNYTGIDPETSLFGADVAQQGFDYFGTPQTRSFTFSVTLHH